MKKFLSEYGYILVMLILGVGAILLISHYITPWFNYVIWGIEH